MEVGKLSQRKGSRQGRRGEAMYLIKGSWEEWDSAHHKDK